MTSTSGNMAITVFPGVWSPAYDWSGEFVISNFPNVVDKRVLEMGCGSGLISIHAALNGAKWVESVDINPKAVENTLFNFNRYKINNCAVYESDGFTNISEKFDVIVFNAPYHGCKPNDILEYAVADNNYVTLKSFFHNLKKHLTENGIAVISFAESGDLTLLRELINKYQFKIIKELSEWKNDYNCMIFELEQIF